MSGTFDTDDQSVEVFQHGHRFAAVNIQPAADYFCGVISTSSGKHPFDENIIRNIQKNYSSESLVPLSEQTLKPLCLGKVAWETIQEPTICDIRIGQTTRNHSLGDVIRNQFTPVT